MHAMNPFLNACGASGPLVLSLDSAGGSEVESRAFDLPFVLIGRDPRCDLRLTRPEVCERHAYLQLVEGRVFCIDLGSRLGVSHGGRPRRVGRIDHDRPIRIGPYRIRLVAGDQETPLEDPFHPDPAREKLDLELHHRSVRKTECSLGGALALIGSASDCQVRLIDPSVSSYHACLIQTASGSWLVDLLGQGGVRINDVEVSYARLHQGDTIQIGRSLVVRAGVSESVTIAVPTSTAFDPPDRIVNASREERMNGTQFLGMDQPGQDHETLTVEREPDPVEPTMPVSEPVGMPTAMAEMPAYANGTPASDADADIERRLVDEFQNARLLMAETYSSLQQAPWPSLSQELEELGQISMDLQRLRDRVLQQTGLPIPSMTALEGMSPRHETTALESPTPEPVAESPPMPEPAPAPEASPFPTLPEIGDYDEIPDPALIAAMLAFTSAPMEIPAPMGQPRIVPGGPSAFGLGGYGGFQAPTSTDPEPAMAMAQVSVPVSAPTATASVTQPYTTPRPETRTRYESGPLLSHDRDAHFRLFERITRTEQKRRSRWQRLLDLIPGRLEPRSTV
jgi:pSer/pThr/pTyr-binding forkhead associated (FHA) protein